MIKYSTILHDVRKKLGLSMNEYAVADSIHKLSERNGYSGKANRTYLSDFLVIDRTNIGKIINRLIKEGLLTEDGNYVTDFWKNEVMYFTSESDVIHPENGCNSPHNNNIININKEIDIAPKEKKYLLTLSLDEIISIWNSVEDKFWIRFTAPKGTATHHQLITSYNLKRNVITNDDFYKGLENYLDEISKRDEKNIRYYKHRFSLNLFMKQSNGLEKFIFNYK